MKRIRALVTLCAAAGALVLLAACATAPFLTTGAYSAAQTAATKPQTLAVTNPSVILSDGKPTMIELTLENTAAQEITVLPLSSEIHNQGTANIVNFVHDTNTTAQLSIPQVSLWKGDHQTIRILPASNVQLNLQAGAALGSDLQALAGKPKPLWTALPMQLGPIQLLLAYNDVGPSQTQPNKTIVLTFTPEAAPATPGLK